MIDGHEANGADTAVKVCSATRGESGAPMTTAGWSLRTWSAGDVIVETGDVWGRRARARHLSTCCAILICRLGMVSQLRRCSRLGPQLVVFFFLCSLRCSLLLCVISCETPVLPRRN